MLKACYMGVIISTRALFTFGRYCGFYMSSANAFNMDYSKMFVVRCLKSSTTYSQHTQIVNSTTSSLKYSPYIRVSTSANVMTEVIGRNPLTGVLGGSVIMVSIHDLEVLGLGLILINWVVCGNFLGQETSQLWPTTGELQETLEYVTCSRDMTEM